ncbi:Gfo/Idh/MocA family oxidoreductase [Paenibacillus sp.]|jgi:predicted dehydrogenase|uniref:Gfo/Idh/MocA family protein n=1 Tax=Paenibacillus sp. TaxID=58172 RepID=UPI002816EBBB|nr:Gfo/Idh/MocA family oxidoreductase [Paenibacillus sp.]MDR0267502.1 Gfo/Idh/MocA family oxidoreductase [Paenibacillus sp.]
MNKIRVGIIGAGSISESHMNSYQKNPDAEIVAICDLNEDRAKAAATKYGAKQTYTDYNELLANPDIDAVSICTWNNSHAEISIAAINAGKHVLVEKPLCRSVEEALNVQKTVRENNKILQVGFVRRYDPNIALLQSFIEKDEFGELYYAKASILRRLGNPGGWFADKERSGGGPLIDIGVHVIDLCWYMLGRPKVKSVSGNVYHKLGNRSNVKYLSFYKAADYDASKNTVEDMANALIRFENGASLMVDVSFSLHAQKEEAGVRIYGTKGGFEIDPALVIATEKHDVMLNIEPQVDNKGFNFVAAFQNEIDQFILNIQKGREPISPVEDGLELMKILTAVYESAEKGVEIQL